MSSSSSSSKQMLDALSDAFYSPSPAQACLPPPSIPPQNTLDNPFFSIDLNTSSVPGPCEDMLPDNMFEGDVPKHRASESNILAASEELVIESLAMMREEARAEHTDALEREEVRPSQPIFDKTPDLGRYSSSSSSESASEKAPLKWKMESRKGKEKVVEENPKRRPNIRSAAQKLMVDALKASARSAAAVRSARTFKVSNLKIPKEKLVELSGEEVEKKNNKKKSEKKRERITKKVKKSQSKGKKSERKRKRTQEPGPQARKVENVNLQEVVDSLRKQAVLAGRVFDMGIITLPGMYSLHDMVEIQSWLLLFSKKSPILHEEEVREFYYNVQFLEDESLLTRVNNVAISLNEEVLGKIL